MLFFEALEQSGLVYSVVDPHTKPKPNPKPNPNPNPKQVVDPPPEDAGDPD